VPLDLVISRLGFPCEPFGKHDQRYRHGRDDSVDDDRPRDVVPDERATENAMLKITIRMAKILIHGHFRLRASSSKVPVSISGGGGGGASALEDRRYGGLFSSGP
jgi:hypothetical protein